ncbi:MAG: lysine 2,3-aminomutase [Catenulispora sp.]|nr:lysine 2,3-aminomutase [Catenulispora sp.]
MQHSTVGRAVGSRFQALGPNRLDEIATKFGIGSDLRESVRLFSLVLPFRVNEYVLGELIDWSAPDADPIFHLFFPQPGMLSAEDERLLAAARDGGDAGRLARTVARIRAGMNPQPEHQLDLNVPHDEQGPVPGVQHKYEQTLLYFPSAGQTCHAYCTYCFRWAQFVGEPELRFSAAGPERAVGYLRRHPEITDVLVTGGDPMVMSADRLRRHLEPFLAVESVQTLRIGTKSAASWPHRYVTDHDADATLRLFEDVVAAGKTLAVMAHLSHPVELEPAIARTALSRVRDTGAVVYCQAPMIGRVNDDAAAWSRLWRSELRAGAVPYYMFVARDTGPRDYFKVPLARAAEIFRDAYSTLPGLARTVRGPVMSTTGGKIVVDGVVREPGGAFFELRYLQARDPALVGRPFRAVHSPDAAWIDDLELAPGTPPDIRAAVRAGQGRNT